jgi:hypothetical protein
MFKSILSKVLPNIDPSVKRLVNFGVWTLYEIKADKEYLLKTDGNEYFVLTPQKAIRTTGDSWGEDVQSFFNTVLFSDAEKPPTIVAHDPTKPCNCCGQADKIGNRYI